MKLGALIEKRALMRGVKVAGIDMEKVMKHFMAPAVQTPNLYGVGSGKFAAASVGIMLAGESRGHQND